MVVWWVVFSLRLRISCADQLISTSINRPTSGLPILGLMGSWWWGPMTSMVSWSTPQKSSSPSRLWQPFGSVSTPLGQLPSWAFFWLSRWSFLNHFGGQARDITVEWVYRYRAAMKERPLSYERALNLAGSTCHKHGYSKDQPTFKGRANQADAAPNASRCEGQGGCGRGKDREGLK